MQEACRNSMDLITGTFVLVGTNLWLDVLSSTEARIKFIILRSDSDPTG